MPQHNNNRRRSRQSTSEPKQCPKFTFGADIENEAPTLYSDTADRIANSFGERGADKSTQLRKFYNEVVKLNQLSQQNGFPSVQVYVHMLKAKVAYAKGRGYVSFSFEDFISQGVNCSNCQDSFSNFKLLFEAVLGFYKKYDKS